MMNHKEEKGKAPPSPNPAMTFDPAHLLGMHSMAATGLPYASLSPFPPSPYSLLGQPPPFPTAAAAMFGGLNPLNPMANPIHAAALSHSLAAASLYGLPKQSGDLGSPPPPPSSHLLPPPSSTPSSSSAASSSSSSRKGKASSSSSSKTAVALSSSSTNTSSNSPSPSSSLALHSSNAAGAPPIFSPFDSAAAAAAAAAMHPYLPGWALNGSAYHMTQLANQMAEAQKCSESHLSSTNKSPSSSSSSQPSSSSLILSANRGSSSSSTSSKSRSSSNSAVSGSNKPRTSSPGSISRKIPTSAHQQENKNSHHPHHRSGTGSDRDKPSSSSPSTSTSTSSSHHHHHRNVPMLNIPLAGSTLTSDKMESKKSSTNSTSSKQQHQHRIGEGMEFDPRSMITPYHLPPELAYLSQSLLLHRPDLAALHSPFMTASPASLSATTTSSSSSLTTASLEQDQRRSSRSTSPSISKRRRENGKSEGDRHSKELTHHQHLMADATRPSSSLSSSSSSTSTNLPFDLSQSSSSSVPGEQHSMDNIRKKKIADQIRKRMTGGAGQDNQSEQHLRQQQQQQTSKLRQHEHQQQQHQQQQQAVLDAVVASGGLGMDLFAAAAVSGYGLSQSDWLEYLAKEKSSFGNSNGGDDGGKNVSSSQGKDSRKSSAAMSLEASFLQQEDELKELQKKYALAMAGVSDTAMDQLKDSHKSEADSEPDNIASIEHSSVSESDGSGRETPKRGTDSADSGSPVKKRCYQTDERELVIPLEHGWNRQTVINGMGRRGIVGDVYYFAPCGKKLKTIPDVMRYIERNPNSDLGRENFSFNTKVNVGQFYEVRGGMTSAPVPLTDTEVLERIEMSRGKRARMQMLARKKREKVAREQALARQIMENKLKRKLELQEMSRRAAELRFEKKLEKQKQKETERKLKEDKALSKQKEKEQKQQERIRLQEQLRKEKELRAQQIIEARSRRQQELEEMRLADTVKRNQEREVKRQQLIMLKEQERERRRQHILLIKALEQRKKQEEKQNKERMREEKLNEKLKLREIRMSQRKVELEVAQELKKPIEDMELKNQKPLPEFPRMGSRMAGRPIADCLMVVEFLNNFGSALNLEKNSIPTLQSLENGLMGDSEEEVEEVMSLVMHLLRFAIDDVGVPNPKEAVTKLNQKITEMEMTDSTMSEILRIFIKARGEKQLSEVLKEKPMEALNPTHKAAILSFLCNELLTSKVITSEIDKHMEGINNLRRDKWIVEGQLRQLRVFQAKKFNKIHRSTMDRRRNNSSSNNSRDSGLGGGDGGDDSMPPTPGKMGGGGSDEEDEDKEDEEGSGNESDGSTSAPISSSNTNLNNMPFEPVDDSLTLDESDKRIENLQKQHLAYRQKVFRSSLRLRSINIGQDRYKRTFWILPMTGGVFVEGMESGEPEDYVEEKERKIKKEKEEEEEEERKQKEAKEEKVMEGKSEGAGVKKELEEGNDDEVKNVVEMVVGEKERKKEEIVDKMKDRNGSVIGETEKEDKIEAVVKSGKDEKGKNNMMYDEANDEEDSIVDDGNNDDEEDEDEEDEENDDADFEDNEMSNMTGISENTSWTDSDFNDSNLSFSGFKTSVSPIRSSSVKVTVDMNGGEQSDEESSQGLFSSSSPSDISKNLSFRLENGMERRNSGEVNVEASPSARLERKILESSSEKSEPGKIVENISSDLVKLNNNSSSLPLLSSVFENGKSHMDESQIKSVNVVDDETEHLKNATDVVNGRVDAGQEGTSMTHDCHISALDNGKTDNVPSGKSCVKVNGFLKDDKKDASLTASDSSLNNISLICDSEPKQVLSVDMTLNKVKEERKLSLALDDEIVEDKLPAASLSTPALSSAASVCVDLSVNDNEKDDKVIQKASPLSPLSDSSLMQNSSAMTVQQIETATKSTPENVEVSGNDNSKPLPVATDILRVPKIGQNRDSSLFSMVNHQLTKATTTTTNTASITVNNNGQQEVDGNNVIMSGAKQFSLTTTTTTTATEKGKTLSLLKPNNSILSSSLLFSSSSLSPTITSPSSSSSSSLSSPPSTQQQSVASDLRLLPSSTASSSSSSSLFSPTHSTKGKKHTRNGQDTVAAADLIASPAPLPAHSKPINRQALPPFHPSAMANPCLDQTPPAAHSSHAHDKKSLLHLSLKDLGQPQPPSTRQSSSNFHQTPPHSFNNPALSVNLYGDTTSASQALSSLASFASPPPAHQHLSTSSSLLTSTPKVLTSTTTSTNTTSAASSMSSKSSKTMPAFSSIIDQVLKNEPEYSSSQLLHHAASQVRRTGGAADKDVPSSSSSLPLSTTPPSSKTPPLSKLPLTSTELSSLITSAMLSSSSSSSSTILSESDIKDESVINNSQQHPMWFSLLPRTPCDELSLTRPTSKSPGASVSSSSSITNSPDLAAVAASLLLNSSSSSVTSLINSLTTSATVSSSSSSSSPSSHSALSLENILSLLQSNSPILSQESPSQSPVLDASSCDFKVPQPPVESSCSSPASSTMTMALNYDPWDLLRAAQGERQFIPANKQHGWWRIFDLGQMKKIMSSTMNRGIREHNLQRSVQRYLDYARGHVTYDSSIGESDPSQGQDNQTKASSNNMKRKYPQGNSPSCSPVKKEKKEESCDEEGEKNEFKGDKDSQGKETSAVLSDEKNVKMKTCIQEMSVDEEHKTDQQSNGVGEHDSCSNEDSLSLDKLKHEGEGEENKKEDENVIIVKKENIEDNDEDEKKKDDDCLKEVVVKEEELADFVPPDKEDCWSAETMYEIEVAAVEDVESLEDRIYHASLQAKSGWKPNRETGIKMVDRTVKEVKDDESYPLDAGIARLLELEANIERRYLKPPLSRSVLLNMSNMASGSGSSDNNKQQQDSGSTDLEEEEDIPPGLLLWRQAVIGSESPAQLSLCTQLLGKSISWEKSIMRVICQNCRKDDNEAELLLCDGCDKGFHTYCFKPKMENIPEGDWYCFECVSKASGTPHCGLCGKKGGRLAHCSKCPRYVHLDCLDPPLPRIPKRWQCANCLCEKGGSKRSRKRKESLPTVQRITKLVVKEEPTDSDDIFPGEATPPPSTSTPSSSSAIKEEPLTITTSSAKRLDVKLTPATAVDGKITSATKNSPLPSSSPPEKKRRKRKEKETSGAVGISPPLPSSSSSASTAEVVLCSPSPPSTSNLPTVSLTLNLTPTSSPASASSTLKKKRQRKTKAEKSKEESVGTGIGTAGLAANNGGVGVIILGKPKVEKDGKVHSVGATSSPSSTTSSSVVISEKERAKEFMHCSKLLTELENHNLGWPFLKPVNKKQFPSYKKFIKTPMDFTTIRNKIKTKRYKHRLDFASDVRLVFDNCETFNEDESEVGQAGHNLRQFFEKKWSDLFPANGP